MKFKKGDKVWVNEYKENGTKIHHEWHGEIVSISDLGGLATVRDDTNRTYKGCSFTRFISELEPFKK